MPQRLEIGIPTDRLSTGQRFRIRRPSGIVWAEVPPGASYGTEIRVSTPEEDFILVLVPPRGHQAPAAGRPPAPPTPPPPAPPPRPPRERFRPGPQLPWRGPLTNRLPERPKVAGTPNFWERVREELWESVRAEREFGGLCVFEERPEGLLLYDIERRWEGTERNVEMVFEEGELLWHTHPNGFFDEAADEFSSEDIQASESAGRPLALFSFGRASPGYLAQFMVLPNLPTIVAGLSIRGILALERRGVLPPNLMRFGIRGKIHLPRRGALDILRVDEEEPRTLAGAHLVGIDRYARPAWERAREAARGAYEAGRRLINRDDPDSGR